VLIADDNVDAAMSLHFLLQHIGYSVQTAHDGEAAFALAQSFRPHVAILDIGMPKLSGHAVAERIRAEAWGQRVLLVALTGWGQPSDRQRALAAGFDRHVTKPIEPDEIEALLSAAQFD
jgi:CheY-like chemotaxis protein